MSKELLRELNKGKSDLVCKRTENVEKLCQAYLLEFVH